MEGGSGKSYYGIEMSEIGSEIFSNSNQFLSEIEEDDELSFNNLDELEIAPALQVSIDNKNNSESSNSIKEQHSKPTVSKMSEKSVSSCKDIANNSESNMFKGLLNFSQNGHGKDHKSFMKQTSSISLPETNNCLRSKKLGKLQRTSTTYGIPQRPELPHRLCFLDDDECHVIWKPNTPHKTTLMKKESGIWTMQSGTGPKSSCDQQNDIVASSAAGSKSPCGIPADLRQKQKQLMERVNLAREVAKDQNNKLVQAEVSQESKQHALRQSSRYISFRMSKKRQCKNGVVFEPTGREDDTQNQSSPAVSNKQLNQTQQDMSPEVSEAKESSMTSLSSINSKVLSANICTNDQGAPLLGEEYTSQSNYTLESGSSSPTKKSSPETYTSNAPINTKQLPDSAVTVEKQDSIRKENSSSQGNAKYPISADYNSVSTVAQEDYKDCNGDSITPTRLAVIHESVVATLTGNTSNNNSNYFTGGSGDEVTTDFPHISDDVFLSQSDSFNNYNATWNSVKSTSDAIPGYNSSFSFSSSDPLEITISPSLPHDQVLMASSTTLPMSEDNSCTNLISSEVTSLYTGQQEHSKITPH